MTGDVNLTDFVNPNPDHAPDIYNINIKRISNSFIFDSLWHPVSINKSCALKISAICDDEVTTYSNGNTCIYRRAINGFEVVDENGYIYLFGAFDINQLVSFSESTILWHDFASDLQKGYVSSWYLNKVYSPYRTDSIEYIYEQDVNIEDIVPSFYIYRSKGQRCQNSSFKTFQHVLSNTIKLKTIKFAGGKIDFFRSVWQSNEDSKLDSIVIRNIDNGYKRIKSFHFIYDYFINKDNTLNLKLTNLVSKGNNLDTIQNYSFIYNTAQLPGRNSCDLDHWGYYNGANNQGTCAEDYSGPLGLIPITTTTIDGMAITEGIGNREPNMVYGQACILEKIIYPTGGYTKFEYEGHITHDNINRGGLRIKNILNYDSFNDFEPSTIKNFQYSGGYLIGFEPQEDSYIRKYSTNCVACRVDYIDDNIYQECVFSSSGKGIYQSQSTTAYEQVLESNLGTEGANLGKTIYNYPKQPDITTFYSSTSSISCFFTPYQNYSLIRENPSFISHFDRNDIKVKEIENQYINSGSGLAMGLMVQSDNNFAEEYFINFGGISGCALIPMDFNPNFFMATYQIMSINNQLSKSIEKNYFSNGAVIDTIKYFYNNTGHPYPVEIVKTSSNGTKETRVTKYPLDYLTSYPETYQQLHQLRDNHILSAVINSSTITNNYINECVVYEYDGLYPKTIYSSEIYQNTIIPSFLTLEPLIFIIPNELIELLKPRYNLKYFKDKLIESHIYPNEFRSFVWSYNNIAMIASVDNARVNEMGYTGFENHELNGWSQNQPNIFSQNEFFTGKASLLALKGNGPGREFSIGLQANDHSGYQASVWVKGTKNAYLHIEANGWSVHERISNVEETDGWHLLKVILYKYQYESLIDSNMVIKVYIGNEGSDIAYFDDLRFYPLDAQMTTYTHEPLIGVTSVSDNNNKPTRYEFDAFGRLKHTRDFQDNILKKNVYHYKP